MAELREVCEILTEPGTSVSVLIAYEETDKFHNPRWLFIWLKIHGTRLTLQLLCAFKQVVQAMGGFFGSGEALFGRAGLAHGCWLHRKNRTVFPRRFSSVCDGTIERETLAALSPSHVFILRPSHTSLRAFPRKKGNSTQTGAVRLLLYKNTGVGGGAASTRPLKNTVLDTTASSRRATRVARREVVVVSVGSRHVCTHKPCVHSQERAAGSSARLASVRLLVGVVVLVLSRRGCRRLLLLLCCRLLLVVLRPLLAVIGLKTEKRAGDLKNGGNSDAGDFLSNNNTHGTAFYRIWHVFFPVKTEKN